MMPVRFVLSLYFVFMVAFAATAQHAAPGVNSHVVDSLLDKLNNTEDQAQQAELLLEIGRAYQDINPEIAMSYFNRGSVKVDTSNDSMVVKFLIEKGSCYIHLNEHHKALAMDLQALRMIDKKNDLEQFRNPVMNNLAGVYMMLKQYTMAESMLNKIAANHHKQKEYHKLAPMYINLSTIAGSQGEYGKCIFYCNKAIEYYKKYPSGQNPLASAYLNAGLAYMKLGEKKKERGLYNKSRIFYNKALQIVKTSDGTVLLYKSLGTLSLVENDPKQAIKHFLMAKQMAEKSKFNRLLPNLYSDLATAYAKAGNIEQSLLYKDKFVEAKDKVFDEQMAKEVNEMRAKYDADKKDLEIASLSKDQEIAHARVERRNLVIVIFGFILIAGFVLTRNILLKQRIKNERLGVENITLQKEKIEAKYEVLKSKTNPHFLFNGLSTLISVINEDPGLAEKFIVRFSQLYRAILETGDTNLVKLEEEMKVVENYLFLQKVRFEDSLILDIRVPKELYHYSVPPFSVQLVVENAIKHNIVNPHQRLTLRLYAEHEMLMIENNLQQRYTGVVSTGIGQESIRERYKLVSDTLPEFIKTETSYLVKLPLVIEDTLLAS